MFWLIKQSLLSVSESLATKFVSLNKEPCMVMSTLIDSNSIELNFHLFMISLDQRSGIEILLMKYVFPVK